MPQNDRHTLLPQHDQTHVDFYSVSDHFGTLCIKRSTVLHLSMQRFLILTSSKMLKIIFLFQFFNEVYSAICFFLYQQYCVKSVRIRSYSGPSSVRMRQNTDQNNSEYEHFLFYISSISYALRELKDPKDDLYCLVRQFLGSSKISPRYDGCSEFTCC